ncbi:hypothetical protein Tco_1234020 [Tanacetum coccineum]
MLKNRYNTNLARILPKQVYSPCIVDWTMLNTLGRGDTIEEMPEIKVNEMGADEILFTSEAWRRAFDINEPIYTELCQEFYSTYEFDEVVPGDELMTKKVIKFRLCGQAHSLRVLDFARHGLSAPTYCRALDVLTLKELTSPNGRLIAEDPTPGVLRAATPRSIRPTITDLYDKIDCMETCHGTLDRMAHRQSYQLDRYAGVFKCMVRQYNVPMQGVCAPPGYNEEQRDDEE